MVVVNPNNSTHTIKLIGRYNPVNPLAIDLYDEDKRVTSVLSCSYDIIDGYLLIAFDYDFNDNQKAKITVLEGDIVVFRGKLIAITQDAQDYDPTDGIYTYSTI